MTDHNFLPESAWVITTHDQLREKLKLLTPEKLDEVCPQLKEWRERAIELQREPAAMAVGMMRVVEERDEWRTVAHQLRSIGEGIIGELEAAWLADEDLQQQVEMWGQAIVGDPWVAEFHLYQNSEVIYCAPSLDRCWELFTEDTGLERSEEEASDPFEQIPDDKEMEIGADESSGDPTEEARPMKNKNGEVVATYYFEKNTAKVWASISREGHFSGGDM